MEDIEKQLWSRLNELQIEYKLLHSIDAKFLKEGFRYSRERKVILEEMAQIGTELEEIKNLFELDEI